MCVTVDVNDIFTSAEIDAVAIVTPVSYHLRIGAESLGEWKACVCGETLYGDLCTGRKLVELAERKNLQIMVDHHVSFTGAVRKIKQLVDDGTPEAHFITMIRRGLI